MAGVWGTFLYLLFPINAKAETVNKLEGTTYYQSSYSVNDYLDRFQALIFKAGYIDFCIVIVKFKQYYYATILGQIAILLLGQLKDTNLNAWFKTVECIDQVR